LWLATADCGCGFFGDFFVLAQKLPKTKNKNAIKGFYLYENGTKWGGMK
jgi:hypothetical protein